MRRRQLGAELRRLREAAEISIEQAARSLGCSGSKISRMETGRVTQQTTDVTKLLDFYGITDETQRADILAVARAARQRDWWDKYTDVVPRWFEALIGLEGSAVSWEGFHAQLVPGLLQTPDYARAITRAASSGLDDYEVDRRVTVRMERQRRLSEHDPLTLWVVLDEAVLRRQVGGSEVMHGQLRHLVASAARPNVTIQILPFTVGAHAAFGSSFVILGFPEPGGGEVVHVEQLTSAVYLEREPDLRRYKVTLNRLRATALDPERSIHVISEVAKEMI
jgi:transcriptional regulator with XRE-family HTH domain